MRSLFAFPLVLSLGSPALAGEVSVQLAGDAFDGSAAFELALDGKAVASGQLDPANSSDNPKTFRFDVPDENLRAAREFSVRLTNDHFVAGKGDRNLYLFGAQVGNKVLSVSDFNLLQDERPQDRKDASLIGLLADNQRAVAFAPQGGWLGIQSESVCDVELQVTGYGINAIDLDQKQKGVLKKFLTTIDSGSCALSIMGYASASGSDEVNRKVSQWRADGVLSFIRDSKVRFASESVVAVGATTQFGKKDQDNRRVVVKIAK